VAKNSFLGVAAVAAVMFLAAAHAALVGRPGGEGSGLSPLSAWLSHLGLWHLGFSNIVNCMRIPQSSDYSASFSCSLRHATGRVASTEGQVLRDARNRIEGRLVGS